MTNMIAGLPSLLGPAVSGAHTHLLTVISGYGGCQCVCQYLSLLRVTTTTTTTTNITVSLNGSLLTYLVISLQNCPSCHVTSMENFIKSLRQLLICRLN